MQSIRRLPSLAVCAPAILLAACSGMAPPSASSSTYSSTSSSASASTPTVPAAIAVPSGNKLAFTLKGSGLLNYECRAKADAPGAFEWALVSPDAVLRDDRDALVGKYYGGPTWEHADGSKVTGKQLAISPSPVAGSIPWQLVQATPTAGSGTMSGVTYVQRINTNAGVPPGDPCGAATVASRKPVRYSADYLFFKA